MTDKDLPQVVFVVNEAPFAHRPSYTYGVVVDPEGIDVEGDLIPLLRAARRKFEKLNKEWVECKDVREFLKAHGEYTGPWTMFVDLLREGGYKVYTLTTGYPAENCDYLEIGKTEALSDIPGNFYQPG